MTGDDLHDLFERGEVAVLDVRTREEYEGSAGYPCDPRQGHIAGAAHLDVAEIQDASGDPAALRRLLEERGVETGKPIVAYCHSGQRSEIASALLRGAGLEAHNYEGSWHEWSRRRD